MRHVMIKPAHYSGIMVERGVVVHLGKSTQHNMDNPLVWLCFAHIHHDQQRQHQFHHHNDFIEIATTLAIAAIRLLLAETTQQGGAVPFRI